MPGIFMEMCRPTPRCNRRCARLNACVKENLTAVYLVVAFKFRLVYIENQSITSSLLEA